MRGDYCGDRLARGEIAPRSHVSGTCRGSRIDSVERCDRKPVGTAPIAAMRGANCVASAGLLWIGLGVDVFGRDGAVISLNDLGDEFCFAKIGALRAALAMV